MRVRKMDTDGDMVFGGGKADYLSNTPETCAISVRTRLALRTGTWFTDTTDGTPYASKVLGERTRGLIDAAIKARILGTRGVTQINNYTSSVDGETRAAFIQADLDTLYGATSTAASL